MQINEAVTRAVTTGNHYIFRKHWNKGGKIAAVEINKGFMFKHDRKTRTAYSPTVFDLMAYDWEVLDE